MVTTNYKLKTSLSIFGIYVFTPYSTHLFDREERKRAPDKYYFSAEPQDDMAKIVFLLLFFLRPLAVLANRKRENGK
jgi:hypothetical protein